MRSTTCAVLLSLVFTTPPARSQSAGPAADAIDEVVRVELQRRQVPGLSLAVIQDGKIVKAKGYGLIEKGRGMPVSESTLFQAGSISKSVAALGALRLVEQGRLALDENVNAKLTTWKVPENPFTREKKVTLRGILSHTAGLTVHGFPGYATDEPAPTLVQVLDGKKPANTAPIRVDVVPGSTWRYSGGGYTVMQQLILDVTGQPFPPLLKQEVLDPLGMAASTYDQPLPDEKAKVTATGHLQDRSVVKGRWHVYPEMAAAGLWTTPSDLARFAIGVQEAVAGKSDKILSRAMARRMITDQKNHDGLGVFLEGSGGALRFSHGGRDEGFDALLVAYAETGQGAAIMINSNDNSRMTARILGTIAREYHWPEFPVSTSRARQTAEVAEAKLVACTGRYEFANNQMISIVTERGRLLTVVDGFADEEFLPEADDRFVATNRDIRFTVLKDSDGQVSGLLLEENGKARKVPRIGPLFHSLKPQTDPDPARTEKVVAVLKALGEGGRATSESPLLTPGARTDFGHSRPMPELKNLRSVTFLAERDVAGRKIERHRGEVSRILHYRLLTDKPDRGLLVHLTSDGKVTDFDIVED